MKIETQEYFKMVKGLLKKNKEVSFKISGNSMAPFVVGNRDKVYVCKIKKDLKKGDFVLYQRLTGQYVMHRIIRIVDNEYYLIGDGQECIEGPLLKNQIFGIVTKVQRKGKWIEPGNFWWEFFEHIWIRIVPWRKFILKMYKYGVLMFRKNKIRLKIKNY